MLTDKSFILIALCLLVSSVQAATKLSGLFADHMVLQRDAVVPVWGTGDVGETVTVSFRGQKAVGVTDASGQWKVELKGLTVGPPSELTVASKDTIVINDVVVGDVWLCSGQSNMGFQVNSVENAESEIAAATFPLIRHFRVKYKVAELPQKTLEGKWQVCSPATVKDFSAVSYFFAREIHAEIGVPIGLVNSSWGGTSATAWMSSEALAGDPEWAQVSARWRKTLAEYPAAQAKFADTLATWEKAAAAAKAAGTPFAQKKPNAPPGPGDRNTPTGLYNGMVAPLIPFAIKGIIWYQGEQDASKYAGYHFWFPALIKQWRRDFGQGDLPFLYVQLPNHNSEGANSLSWAMMRGVQAEALALPNTGMAVTIDVGENENVHPKRKQPVGHRLALIAESQVYGKKVTFEGPVFDSSSAEGDAMIVHFKRGAEGLKMKGETLHEFQLAGVDKKFKPAKAVISGSTLRVTSDEVPAPVSVRYAWRNGSEANLYNAADLPAAPFRLDDW